MFNFIGFTFYGIAIADFLGMFFGYDFTGQAWSPLLFGGIGYALISIGEKSVVKINQAEIINSNIGIASKDSSKVIVDTANIINTNDICQQLNDFLKKRKN